MEIPWSVCNQSPDLKKGLVWRQSQGSIEERKSRVEGVCNEKIVEYDPF